MSFPSPRPWVPGKLWPAVIRHAPVQGAQGVADGQAALSAYVAAYQPPQIMATAPAQNHFFAPLPTYPASNMPDMWNRLHPYISQSPTLRHQLAQLGPMGWSVRWNQGQGALCDPVMRQISIDAAMPHSMVMQYLAHETRHAFEVPLKPASFANDVAYASAKMRNEAVAVLNHMQVRSEIFQGTGIDIGYSQPNPAYYENAVNFGLRHGHEERLLRHIQRLMAWEPTDTRDRPYWEVYLNQWRTAYGLPQVSVPPAMREDQRAQAWSALALEMNGR